MNISLKENLTLFLENILTILIWVSVWNISDYFFGGKIHYYWIILIFSILFIYLLKGKFSF